MRSEPRPEHKPDASTQRTFWDGWNSQHRTDAFDTDRYRVRQLAVAREFTQRVKASAGGRPLDICDFGSGTGWLAGSLQEFGRLTAVDLSPAACEWGQRQYPDVEFVVGDLLEADLGRQFDLVVSVDVIAHVADQARFVARVADMLRPGGAFLLMTQNGRIWSRTSTLKPQQPGQIRNWLSIPEVDGLLAPRFEIERVRTIHPSGDQGVLRVVNSRWLSAPLSRVGLGEPWMRLRERAGLGCELVLEARRAVSPG